MSDLDVTPTPRDRSVCDAVQQGERCPMGATLRERVLTVARAELALGVREDAGPNRDSAGRIAGYLAGCVRDGRRLGLTAAPWCAAFVSWCVWRAWTPEPDYHAEVAWLLDRVLGGGNPAIGYRAAVAELCADARATGALHVTLAGHLAGAHDEPRVYVPQAGDVCVMGRDGHSPLRGGEGHAAFYVGEDEHGNVMLLGGNQAPAPDDPDRRDGVTVRPHAPGDVLAWIALEG